MDIPTLYAKLGNITQGVSIDTRTITSGVIFFGIKGENTDGNIFAKDALEKGASYAIVDNPAYAIDERIIPVENTLHTLQMLAAYKRRLMNYPVLVIGGSNGKTTTKELVITVLKKKYKTYGTAGNLNNDIGVPLTLLQLPVDTEFAIVEIGANHPGEHIALMEIVQPDFALVTNNGADHLEGFGSLEGVRQANKEIFDESKKIETKVFVSSLEKDLVEDSGECIQILYPKKTYTPLPGLTIGLVYDNVELRSKLAGDFNYKNILSAIAVGEFFDIAMKDIVDAIQSYEPTLKRSQLLQKDTYTILMDCYNANPSSMELAIRSFVNNTPSGSRIFIIGDMFELGEHEPEAHRELIVLLEKSTAPGDTVLCIGPRLYAQKNNIFHFYENTENARTFFETLQLQDKIIFVKGSNGIHAEDVIKKAIA